MKTAVWAALATLFVSVLVTVVLGFEMGVFAAISLMGGIIVYKIDTKQ